VKGVIPWQNDPAWPHSVPEIEIDLDRTALLVVDMQNPDNFEDVGDNCAKLLAFFREHDLESVYLRVGYFLRDRRDMSPKRAEGWRRREDGTAPDSLRGSETHAIIDRLSPKDGEMVIDKNSTSAFNSSSLEPYLRARQVENIVICGTATNHCVDNTARGAADRGYNVLLIDDACKDQSARLHEATMRTFRRDFGAVKDTDEVIGELAAIAAPPASGG
jgi:nicotinamidase-related amidase